MTATPRPDDFRSAQIRSALYDTVAADARPRRRIALTVSIAVAAAVVLGGGGAVLATTLGQHAGGTGVAVPSASATPGGGTGTTPVDPSDPSSSGSPGYVEGAGSPSPTPIAPDSDLEKAYDSCSAYAQSNGVGTLTPFDEGIGHVTTNSGDFALEPGITTPEGTKATFLCILPGYPADLTVSPQSSPFDAG